MCLRSLTNVFAVHKQKEQPAMKTSPDQPKKHRLVFSEAQRRTLRAIFKETPRPTKEMQIAISRQLGLELTTVANFFMNARRRCRDKWQEEEEGMNCSGGDTSSGTESMSG